MTEHHPNSGAGKTMPAVTRRALIGVIPALAATPAMSLATLPVSAPSSGVAQLIEAHRAKRAEYDVVHDRYSAIYASLSPSHEMVLTRDIFTGEPVMVGCEWDVERWAAKFRVESLSTHWEAIRDAKLADVRIHRAKYEAAYDAAGLPAMEAEMDRLCTEAVDALTPILDYVPQSPADVSAVACYLTQDGEGIPTWVEDYEVVRAFQSLAKAVL